MGPCSEPSSQTQSMGKRTAELASAEIREQNLLTGSLQEELAPKALLIEDFYTSAAYKMLINYHHIVLGDWIRTETFTSEMLPLGSQESQRAHCS